MEEQKMSFDEFEKKYMTPVKRWDFSKFAIICKKCGSSKVEYNNDIEFDTGLYSSINGTLVVKCHDCGNAFTIDGYDMTN
jgi:ribosomal protein S27E